MDEDEIHDLLFIISTGVCVLIIFYSISKKVICRSNVRHQKLCDSGKFSFCSFPNCIRCNKNKEVFQIAAEKLKNVLPREKDSTSSETQIHDKFLSAVVELGNPSQSHTIPGQCPLIFHYPGLSGSPVWDCENNSDLEILKDNFSVIFSDFEKVFIDGLGKWKQNNTPTGSWKIFHLLDQGTEVKGNIQFCKQTMQITRRLPNVMMKNLFGTVAFSILEPGTTITEHYGPTNVRLRSHLGLLTPDENCYLDVNGKKKIWKKKQCLLFDDSFRHSVTYTPNNNKGLRAVFIVDLWHPDLSIYERDLIDVVFAPF